jgi:RhtB (resistance to homoserine/threonine) family protein
MMDSVQIWFMLVGLMMVALASPGPDFVMAVRNSLRYSRIVGVMTALGFACGVLIHVTLVMSGFAVLLQKFPFVFEVLKYAGAGYLLYIGVKSLLSKNVVSHDVQEQDSQVPDFSLWNGFLSGFVTNILNPKALIFFMAVLSQFIHANQSLVFHAVILVTVFSMTFLWFSAVAIFLTTQSIRQKFLRLSQWIDRICGVALIALGLKLALTKL